MLAAKLNYSGRKLRGFFAEADSLKGKTYDIEDDSKKESSQKHRDLLMSSGNQMCPTHAQSL